MIMSSNIFQQLLFSFLIKSRKNQSFDNACHVPRPHPMQHFEFFPPKSKIIHVFAVDVSLAEVNCLASWGEQPSSTEQGRREDGCSTGECYFKWAMVVRGHMLLQTPHDWSTDDVWVSLHRAAATWRHLTHMADFHGHSGTKQGADQIIDDFFLLVEDLKRSFNILHTSLIVTEYLLVFNSYSMYTLTEIVCHLIVSEGFLGHFINIVSVPRCASWVPGHAQVDALGHAFRGLWESNTVYFSRHKHFWGLDNTNEKKKRKENI